MTGNLDDFLSITSTLTLIVTPPLKLNNTVTVAQHESLVPQHNLNSNVTATQHGSLGPHGHQT